MRTLLPALLAGGAVAVAGGLPRPAVLRLRALAAGSTAAGGRSAGSGGRAAAGGVSARDGGRGRVVLVAGAPAPGAGGAASQAAPAGRSRGGRLAGLHLPTAVAGSLAASGVLAVLLGPVLAVLLGAGLLLAARLLRARAGARDRALERRHAVQAAAALAAELRAGRTPAQALSVAADVARGPSQEALAGAAATAGWGGDVAAALRAGPGDSAAPELVAGLAACWQVCAPAGSGLAAAVERIADGLRARAAHERAVAGVLAGPRSSAALLAVLPLGGLLLAAGLGADPVHVLLHTRLGVVALFAGLTLDALGLWWTARITARAAAA